jgi:hypothetical protein
MVSEDKWSPSAFVTRVKLFRSMEWGRQEICFILIWKQCVSSSSLFLSLSKHHGNLTTPKKVTEWNLQDKKRENRRKACVHHTRDLPPSDWRHSNYVTQTWEVTWSESVEQKEWKRVTREKWRDRRERNNCKGLLFFSSRDRFLWHMTYSSDFLLSFWNDWTKDDGGCDARAKSPS